MVSVSKFYKILQSVILINNFNPFNLTLAILQFFLDLHGLRYYKSYFYIFHSILF